MNEILQHTGTGYYGWSCNLKQRIRDQGKSNLPCR